MKRKSDGGIQERNLHVHFRRGLSFSKLYMEDESLLLTRLSLSKLDPLTPVCPQALLSPFPVIQGEWGVGGGYMADSTTGHVCSGHGKQGGSCEPPRFEFNPFSLSSLGS